MRFYKKDELRPDRLVIDVRTDIKASVLMEILDKLYDYSLGSFVNGDDSSVIYDEVWQDPIISGFELESYRKDSLRFTVDFNREQDLPSQVCRVGYLFYRHDTPNMVKGAQFCSQGADKFMEVDYGIGTKVCRYNTPWTTRLDYDGVPPADYPNKDRYFLEWALAMALGLDEDQTIRTIKERSE